MFIFPQFYIVKYLFYLNGNREEDLGNPDRLLQRRTSLIQTKLYKSKLLNYIGFGISTSKLYKQNG